jgi:hypothetical protein
MKSATLGAAFVEARVGSRGSNPGRAVILSSCRHLDEQLGSLRKIYWCLFLTSDRLI